MSENLKDLAAELITVDSAIHDVPLYADPSDPTSNFSDQLVDLIAREEKLIGLMIRQAREEVSRDEPATIGADRN
ncbi:MAG TPA: hypothetical protein VGK17_05685 [Propionicimonas sp.]|jgi:hypothetical protein